MKDKIEIMKQWNMIKEENVITKKKPGRNIANTLELQKKGAKQYKQRIEQRIKRNKQKNT